MRLVSFSVKGFKNFRAAISLDQLQSFNIIHGENNVGKSNLLQAIGLFFACLDLGQHPQQQEPPIALPHNLEDPQARVLLGLEKRDYFTNPSPTPIEFSAKIAVSTAELKGVGIEFPTPVEQLDVRLRIDEANYIRLLALHSPYQNYLAGWKPTGDSPPHAQQIRAMLAYLKYNGRVGEFHHRRFAYVRTIRNADNELALEMFDARDSTDITVARRWTAFQNAMKTFEDLTGRGTFHVRLDRNASPPKAQLLFETENARIPLRLMGSGVQQLASILGHATMSNASILAIEEPEQNLRYALQERLGVALRGLTEDPNSGISQIFVTSHSPAFESRERFLLMEKGTHSPTIRWAQPADVGHVLGFAPRGEDLPEQAPLSYVTSQGVVRVPPETLTHLGLSQGGGVVFLDEPGKHSSRILSDDSYLAEIGINDDGKH